MPGVERLLNGYHNSMNSLFDWYGSFTARRPAIPLIIGIVVLGGLCFGLFNVQKETDLEKLWVEHNSRVVEEKEYFDARFGGIARLQAVTITPRNGNASDLNLVHAMDALKSAVAPLYDNLTMQTSINGSSRSFRENDFCERPLVPDTIKSGTNPLIDGNFLSWGYSRYANCSLRSAGVLASIGLPDGWGIDWLPCIKLSPLDCFREGGDFDYPSALKLLEQETSPGTTIAQFLVLQNEACVQQLKNNYTALFQSFNVPVQNSTIDLLAQGVTGLGQLFATWGYGWRKSYAGMTNQQVIDHINTALQFGKSASLNPASPQVTSCVFGKLPCCMTYFGAHSPTLTSLGDVSFNSSSGFITKIGGLRWAANNFHFNHPVWKSFLNKLDLHEKQREDLTKAWESRMINQLNPLRKHAAGTSFADKSTYGDLQLEFNMWRSSEDIISDANKTPIWQIVLSGILVSIYSFLAFVNFRDPVHSHTWVALTGMLVVSLAVVAGFGFSAVVGIKLTPLAGSVVPFLTLGLGIDDVFVLVNVLRNYLKDPNLKRDFTSKIPDAEMRMTATLAGPSVVLTTFSVLASFFISSLSPMPIVRWFCWQMGITATVHTLGMLLIFMPIMSIDARRVRAGVCDPYLWMFCGIRRKKHEQGSLSAKDTMMPEEHLPVAGASLLSQAVAKYYAPLFQSNVFKGIVVVLFAALLAVTTYLGFAKVEHGLLLSDITLKGSYQNTFAVVTEHRFLSYQINYVTRDIDFAKNQENLLRSYVTFQNNLSYWVPPQPKVLEASVLGNIMIYTAFSRLDVNRSSVNVSGNTLFTIPEDVFDQVQQAWSATPLGVFSLPDYYCEDKTTKQQMDCATSTFNPNLRVGATKTSIYLEHLGAETRPNLQMIRETRKVADNLNTNSGEKLGFVYGYPFLFFEQYLHSERDLYMVVGFALLGVFAAVLIFQFSIVISFLIVIVLLMVDLEVYGFIYIIGAKLNSLSLVNLGIVIGMAAELTYLARSFLMVEGTRNYRVGKALEWTMEPLLHGFGTQVAATLPLLFLKYHAFRVYYFAMFTIMGVLSFLNGFVLLPVLLSWFGPPPLPSRISSSKAQVKDSQANKQDASNGHSAEERIEEQAAEERVEEQAHEHHASDGHSAEERAEHH